MRWVVHVLLEGFSELSEQWVVFSGASCRPFLEIIWGNWEDDSSLDGGVVVCVWIRPRSEERCRERWMRWWSENPEVLRVVVVVCEGAAWCGSCMAKWSIDDSDV